MSARPEDPDWDRLPHDPIGFFGLESPFERRDLKRKYNELIRRFKPERFPVEFQRIRAAFEQLDLDLRYGASASQPALPADEYRWQTDSQSASAPETASHFDFTRTRGVAPQSAPAAQLHERVQRESVTAIYRELEAKQNKTAFDFYSLAVLSDVVDRADGLQFANWLLKGLVAHDNDLGLLRLLHEYVRGPLPNKAAEKLLLACSRSVSEDFFFPLTEPVWQSLLREGDFPRFRATLDSCEANLKGLNIDGRIAFYLQLLKSAMWQADEGWIDASMQFIETNFQRIPPFLEYDVEIIAALRAYIRVRPAFVASHPICKQMDQAVRDYFTEDQTVGDRGILECQIRATQDTAGLATAFSQFDEPAYGPFWNIWMWIAYDVGERHVEGKPPTADDDVWFSRTRTLLTQIESQTNRSRLGLTWYAYRIAYFVTQGMLYFVVLMIVVGIAAVVAPTDTGHDGFAAFVGLASVLVAMVGVYQFNKRILKKRVWLPYCLRISARCYRQMWRPEIINFLARSHVPYPRFAAFVGAAVDHNLSTSQWVQFYVDKDYTLAVYSLAQRFMI